MSIFTRRRPEINRDEFRRATANGLAHVDRLQATIDRLIAEASAANAANRKLLAAAKGIDLESLIIDQAHANARRLVALRAAGRYVSRHNGDHGLTHDQWAWAYAVLRNAGIRSQSGGWRVNDVDEAYRRIDQSLRQCQSHGLKMVRRFNHRARHYKRRRRPSPTSENWDGWVAKPVPVSCEIRDLASRWGSSISD